jgi:tetratricopeptide (TPR) repeat protein
MNTKQQQGPWWIVFGLIVFLAGTSIGSAQPASDLESLNQQVLTLLRRGRFNDALPLALQALKLSEDVFGPEDATTATCLNDLGGVYENLGEYEKAEQVSERALKIREKVLGPEHPFTARNLNNLANIWVKMGNYAKAEPLLQRALAINEKSLGPEAAATGGSLNSLGLLYWEMGEYAKAEPLLQRALAVCEKAAGEEASSTLASLNNLAALYFSMGSYTEAEPLFLRSLNLREKSLGEAHPNTAQSLDALAALYLVKGDYEKAETFYKRALAIQEKNPGPDHPDCATTLGGLAMVYINMGDFSKAEPMIQRGLKIQEKAFGPDHPETARMIAKLAGIYEKLGDTARAKPLHQRILAIDEKVLGPDHPETAISLINLAADDENLGNHTNAEALYLRALGIQEKVFGPEHPQIADNLNNLAAVYQSLKEFDRAEPLCKRAYDIDQKLLGPDHPTTLLYLQNLAFLYYDTGNLAVATDLAKKVAQGRLTLLGNILSFTSEQERLAYQARCNPYSLFASLSNAPELTLAILRNKGIVLDSLIEDHLVAEASAFPEDHARIEKLVRTKQRLTELLMQVPNGLHQQDLERRAEERQSLSSEVETLEGALARNVAGLGGARRALTVTVNQVQEAIPRHSVLVEVIRYNHYIGMKKWEQRYGAAVLPPAGDVKWVCFGPAAAIDANILRYQQLVRSRGDEAGLKIALKDLYRQVWAPIEAFLPNETQTAIISPDAGLSFVSFATLLTPDDEFLAQKYSLRYVASGRDLLHNIESASNSDMVVFANPDYSGNAPETPLRSGLHLSPLPNFATNAQEIEAQAKKWNWPVQVYLGTNATESALRKIRSPHILHLATHGFLLPETIRSLNRFSFMSMITGASGFQDQVILRNPMQRSGVALAGAQTTLDAWQRGEIPPTDTDGILTAEEVSELNLRNTYLVVLAACDTGIGELRIGEGVLGLRRGFAQAGSQNLLMTLWPVFDKSTGDFMLDFYAALQRSGNASESLAKVQRDWLVKLRKEHGLLAAVILGGPFILSSQGSLQSH